MIDADFRALERATKTGDAVAVLEAARALDRVPASMRYLLRVALVAGKRPELAGFEPGDLASGWVPLRVLSAPASVVVVAMLAREESDVTWIAGNGPLGSGWGTVAPENLRLVTPFDVKKSRRLLNPQGTMSRWRERFRPHVQAALEASWCFGARPGECHFRLRCAKPFPSGDATWLRQAWAAEVGARTNGALGRGSREPMGSTPLFDREAT